MTLQAEPSAEQRLAPARAEAPPLFAAGAARPDPRALQLALVEAASARYRAGGRFAWHFARGKLGMDPLFIDLLRLGLLPAHGRFLDLGCGQAAHDKIPNLRNGRAFTLETTDAPAKGGVAA